LVPPLLVERFLFEKCLKKDEVDDCSFLDSGEVPEEFISGDLMLISNSVLVFLGVSISNFSDSLLR
jgi:hypothetical protein